MGAQQRVKVRRKKKKRYFKPEGASAIYVISHGYGELHGHIQVGEYLRTTTRGHVVQFKDDSGYYKETYSVETGKRLTDLGNRRGGWKINLSDVRPGIEVGRTVPQSTVERNDVGQHRFVLVGRDEFPYGAAESEAGDVLMIEVWEDRQRAERFIKAYRTGPRDEDDPTAVRKIRERGVLVPFTILKQVLAQYEITGELEGD